MFHSTQQLEAMHFELHFQATFSSSWFDKKLENLSPYSMVTLVGQIFGVSSQDMAKARLDEPGCSSTAAAWMQQHIVHDSNPRMLLSMEAPMTPPKGMGLSLLFASRGNGKGRLTWRLSKALRSSLLRCTAACHLVQARCRDEAKQALLAFCTLARFSWPNIINSFQLANALHINASQPAHHKTALQVTKRCCCMPICALQSSDINYQQHVHMSSWRNQQACVS